MDSLRRRGHLKVENHYYASVFIGDVGDNATVTGDNSPVARDRSVVATGQGTAAGERSAAASGGSTAAAGRSKARVGEIKENAKKSRWFQVWAAVSILLLIVTTVLVVAGAFGLNWGGYVLAVIAALIGVPPLLRG